MKDIKMQETKDITGKPICTYQIEDADGDTSLEITFFKNEIDYGTALIKLNVADDLVSATVSKAFSRDAIEQLGKIFLKQFNCNQNKEGG